MMRLRGLLSGWLRFVDVVTLRLYLNALNGDATKCAIQRAKCQKVLLDVAGGWPQKGQLRTGDAEPLAMARRGSRAKLKHSRVVWSRNGCKYPPMLEFVNLISLHHLAEHILVSGKLVNSRNAAALGNLHHSGRKICVNRL
jgi:hypothetical protein